MSHGTENQETALVGLDIEELETRTAPITFVYGSLGVKYGQQQPAGSAGD
jgi:hypothetical protein